MHQALLSFNAGEVSPYLRHRIDFEKSSSSAELMENFIAMPYGGVMKRPGLRWMVNTLTAGEHSKAFPFIASDGTRYVIHFAGYSAGVSSGVITVYRAADGTTAATLSDTATEGPHPSYLWLDTKNPLRTLQMVAVNDVMFFSHANLHPFQIRRMSDTYWKLEWIPFTNPPLLDENTDDKWNMILSSDPQPVNWTVHRMYHVSDVVAYLGNVYTCILAHPLPVEGLTRDALAPVGTDDAACWVAGNAGTVVWDIGIDYKEGDLVTHNDAEYVCRHWHTSSTEATTTDNCNEPGVGRFFEGHDFFGEIIPMYGWQTWQFFWARKMYAKGEKVKIRLTGGTEWSHYKIGEIGTDNTYYRGDTVYRNGCKYVANRDHRAWYWTEPEYSGTVPEFEPIIGTPVPTHPWSYYWDMVEEIFPAVSPGIQSPGEFIELKISRNDDDMDRQMTAIGTHSGKWTIPIQVKGGWQFFTYGSWIGSFFIQESKDNGLTWKQIRSYKANGDRNVADRGIAEDARLLRLGFIRDTSGAGDPNNSTLVPDDVFVEGRVRVTQRVDGSNLKAVIVNPSISGKTYQFAKSAFSEIHGFPRALCLHESRLCLAGTSDHPVSFWMSRTDDFLNFEPGVNPDHAIFATLATSTQAPIQWLSSQRRMFIGTSLGEWVAGSETTDAPMTPADCVVHQYAANGSAPVQPLLVGPSLLFCTRNGGRLMEMSYSSVMEVYDTADLSRLAEHLTHAGIRGMGWQQTREPGMWLVRHDGVLIHFAYSRAEKIAAWSQHNSAGGVFRDVVVLPSEAGDDEVFFIVDRGAVSCLERFPQHWQAAIENGAAGIPWFHVDGVAGSGSTISIPAHLRNVALSKVTLPASTPSALPTVATATFTGATSALGASSWWQIGFPIVSRLTGLPIDTQVQDGTTQARRKRQHKLILSIFRSRGGYVWNTLESSRQPVANTQPNEVLRTGWEETIPDAGHLDDLQLHVYHGEIFPFCLRCAVMRWKLHEA